MPAGHPGLQKTFPLLACLLVLLHGLTLLAQDDDAEQAPGLVMERQLPWEPLPAGQENPAGPANDAPHGDTPSSRTAIVRSIEVNGRELAVARVRWTGLLLVKPVEELAFHGYFTGELHVKLAGQLVLDGTHTAAGWKSGAPLTIEPGLQPLEIEYTAPADSRAGRLWLGWSAREHALEPVPWHALFHDVSTPEASAAARQRQLVERGRQLFTAYRCNRCHTGDLGETRLDEYLDTTMAAPAIMKVGNDLNPEWLLQKLLFEHPEAVESKMPTFGINAEQAELLADALWRMSQPAELVELKTVEPARAKQSPSGLELIQSVGCLACHTLDGQGRTGPFAGGDLGRIGGKRSGDWLATWLAYPDRLNPQHRMPVFKLTPTERNLIAGELAKRGGKPETQYHRAGVNFEADRIKAGRDLVRSLRCANCHKIPAIEADSRKVPTLVEPVADWNKSCLNPQPDFARSRPAFPHADTSALRAYLESKGQELRAIGQRPAGEHTNILEHSLGMSDQNLAENTLERRNCLACHAHNGGGGLAPVAADLTQAGLFPGQSQLLVPPRLAAVGDKFEEAALLKAVSGANEEPRLDWLKVRMPRFNHDDEERQALLTYFQGRDRIPDGAPQGAVAPPPPADDALLTAGRTLVGAGGWNCIACHQIGDYVPKAATQAARGADLRGIGNRVRYEFYQRWCRAPLRVAPGIEMPNYDRPVPGVLDGTAPTQLAALWAALNDPRFEAPTNPTAVEQVWVVPPGHPPRLNRDVFTVHKENGGGYVARTIAVGFDNGHAALFDLDRLALRGWSYGDFARQRTEGKSWYWDLAGLPVMTGFTGQPELALYHPETKAWLLPRSVGRAARLVQTERRIPAAVTPHAAEGGTAPGTSEPGDNRIAVTYQVTFSGERSSSVSTIYETWKAVRDESRTGWDREIRIEILPDGYQLAWLEPRTTAVLDSSLTVRRAYGPGAPHPADAVPGPPVMIDTPDGRRAWLVDPQLHQTLVVEHRCQQANYMPVPPAPLSLPPVTARVTSVPGHLGRRLPLSRKIMPTSLKRANDGRLLCTSLNGDVGAIIDSDGDGLPDHWHPVAEGLSAPFGVLDDGNDVLVAHKPELLRIGHALDQQGQPTIEVTTVLADGWGVTADYHDWTTGIVRDGRDRLYIGLGSDYSQKERSPQELLNRGKVLRLDPSPDGRWRVVPIAGGFRYPVGLAIDWKGRLAISDQQGVQNTFNEINFIAPDPPDATVPFYGVAAKEDAVPPAPEQTAIQVPHPWTRSVNGIVFRNYAPDDPFSAHGLGCEYNGRFLIRFTIDQVDHVTQGAVYEFSDATPATDDSTFLGPICAAIGPNGKLFVGSIHDSGWLGGQNTGEIVLLERTAEPLPLGIQEVRVVPDGFRVDFTDKVDPQAAADPSHYTISGYTRHWKGEYATADSGRFTPSVMAVTVAPDQRRVLLQVDSLKAGFVYDITIAPIGSDQAPLFPRQATYTLNQIPIAK